MTDMFYWAKLAYEAYGEQMKWKNFLGEPMPTWDDLPLPIKAGWERATFAVRSAEIGACGAGRVCKARA